MDVDIDEVGIFLEHQGLSDEAIDEYFEHFGMLGQKWGIRKGKGTTGVSRRTGVKIDRNQRRIANRQKGLDGKKYRLRMKIGNAYIGKPENRLRWQRTIDDLKTQNVRRTKGKRTVEDKLKNFGAFTVSGLIVSRTSTYKSPVKTKATA